MPVHARTEEESSLVSESESQRGSSGSGSGALATLGISSLGFSSTDAPIESPESEEEEGLFDSISSAWNGFWTEGPPPEDGAKPGAGRARVREKAKGTDTSMGYEAKGRIDGKAEAKGKGSITVSEPKAKAEKPADGEPTDLQKGVTALEKAGVKLPEELMLAEGEVEGSKKWSVFDGHGQAEVGDGTLTAKAKVLDGSAKGKASYAVGANGVEVAANGSAESTLVSLDSEWVMPYGPFEFLGEEFSGEVYVFASGDVSAKAAAQIEANAKLMKSQGVADTTALLEGTGLKNGEKAKGDKDEEDGPGADGSASAEVFVGAKAEVGAGGVFDWNRGDKAQYQAEMQQNADLILGALTASVPGLGWLLKQVKANEAITKLIQENVDWEAGPVTLLAAEGMIQGSAGVGARINAKAAFSGGKITFNWQLGATFGLGGGCAVKLSLDTKEGMKLALVTADNSIAAIGQLGQAVSKWVLDNIGDIGSAIANIWDSVFGWLSADDKIREAVAQKAHEVSPADVRGGWIKTLSGGWCSDEDEAAIVEILKFSSRNGDLGQVLASGLSKEDLLDDLSGDNLKAAKSILGG